MLFDENKRWSEIIVITGLVAYGIFHYYIRTSPRTQIQTAGELLEEGLRASEKLNDTKAISSLTTLYNHDQTDTTRGFNLGVALMRMQNCSEAKAHFESIIKQKPNHIPSLVCLESINSSSKNKGKKPSQLAKLNINSYPKNDLCTDYYLAIHKIKLDPEEAKDDFFEIIFSLDAEVSDDNLGEFPRNLLRTHAQFGLGRCFQQQGMKKDALEFYEDVKESNPEYRDIFTGKSIDSYINEVSQPSQAMSI